VTTADSTGWACARSPGGDDGRLDRLGLRSIAWR
jgi:hypothetical protein